MDKQAQQEAARRFAREWQGRGYEKGEAQPFWLALLRDVFGVEQPERVVDFEMPMRPYGALGFVDAYVRPTRVLIEQKALGRDLRKAELQSDGVSLTPYMQAKRYADRLPFSLRPRWIVACNFSSFLVYDMEQPGREPEEILLARLPEDCWRLQFLVDSGDSHVRAEEEVSLQAGEIVARLYDALLREYRDPSCPATLRSLNVLCVRLVFCLYAEDAGLFGRHGQFHDYLAQYPSEEARRALIELFRILDTPAARRDPYEREALLAFPYVNGGLFAEADIEIPRLTPEIMTLILKHASDDFDWSRISPTIFGALFESTLNPDTRRRGGMHYTSVENIHRVIDPLFLDSLRRELDHLRLLRDGAVRARRIGQFRDRLASLRFLDPACGSGNFLTETYLSLRRLENDCLCLLWKGQQGLGDDFSPIKVSIGQFYGIELNDFAVSVARTALWIAEAQMMQQTELIVGHARRPRVEQFGHSGRAGGSALEAAFGAGGGHRLCLAHLPLGQRGDAEGPCSLRHHRFQLQPGQGRGEEAPLRGRSPAAGGNPHQRIPAPHGRRVCGEPHPAALPRAGNRNREQTDRRGKLSFHGGRAG